MSLNAVWTVVRRTALQHTATLSCAGVSVDEKFRFLLPGIIRKPSDKSATIRNIHCLPQPLTTARLLFVMAWCISKYIPHYHCRSVVTLLKYFLLLLNAEKKSFTNWAHSFFCVYTFMCILVF